VKTETIFDKITALLSGRLRIIRLACKSSGVDSTKLCILIDQVIDSLIVAGITGISSYVAIGQDASVKSALLAFMLTFLIKMKEYRKIQ
jgi:hypothetical protein